MARSHLVETLRRWAALASTGDSAGWSAIRLVIEAARRDGRVAQEHAKHLVAESNRRLAPLKDPLETNLGLHRWLANDREEAYSDWFHWVIEQLSRPEWVFALLGLDHVWLRACNGLSCSTVREQTIPGGRLDLVIRYGLTALLVVEIKVTSAEDADTAKQSNYVAWLNKQPARRRKAILVCLDPQQEEYDGFRPIGWDRVAVNLRLLVRPLVLDGNLTAAAMTLAFAGAVEQNLLKLPNLAMKPSTSVLLQMPRLVKHLENAAIGVRIEE